MKHSNYLIGAVLAFAASVSAFAEDARGDWSGVVANIRLNLRVEEVEKGQLVATLTSPSQSHITMKVDRFEASTERMSFAIDRLNASYEARWVEAEKSWVGVWTQGQQGPLTLKRVDAAALAAMVAKRPQQEAILRNVPPYAQSEVSFKNGEAQVSLAGTLTLPSGKGPFPAVVLVHGSGPNSRDQVAYGHKIFFVLADHLSRQGIAVLRYDKRGIGASTGNYATATSFDLAADAEAALAYMRTRPEVDARRLGLVGHSEGGLIAPLVASKDPALGFVVMLAGPGLRGDALLVEQSALMAAVGGEAPQSISRTRALDQSLYAAMMGEKDPELALGKARAILDQAEKDGVLPAGMGTVLMRKIQGPWFHAFLSYDPIPVLGKVRQPVLALNGSLDLQVPAKPNLGLIAAALKDNPQAVIKELPDLNHLFQTAKTGSPMEYGIIEETLSPLALSAISDWILETTR